MTADCRPAWCHFVLLIGVGWIAAVTSSAADPPRVDNHGDPLPDGAVARFGTLQFRRGAGRVAIRPDGKTFVDVDQSLLMRTHDAATGRLLDAKQLPIDGVEGISAIARNGRTVLVKLAQRQTYVALDLESGKRLGTLEMKEPLPYRMDMTADGKTVALTTTDTRTDDGHVILWDVATGAHREIGRHRSHVTVRFSPDDKTVFAADPFGWHAWDVASGAELWTCKGQFEEDRLDFAPDGKSLLVRRSFQPSEWMRLDATTGKLLAGDKWPDTKDYELSWFCPDGRVLLSKYPKGVRIWDPKTGTESLAIPESGGRLAFFPDGKSFLGAYPGGGMLQRWDLTTGKPLWPDTTRLGHTAQLIRLAFDTTGRSLATSAHDGTVRVWDAAKRSPLAVIPFPRPAGGTMLFSRDGRFLFFSTQEEWIQWDVTAGKEVRRVSTKPTALGQDMYSFFVSARLSADERELIGTLFTEDGSGVRRTGSIVVWDLETGKERIRRDNAFRDRGVALVPDGTQFVQTNGKIHDTRTGRERPSLQIPSGLSAGPFWGKPAIALSPDGRFAASGVTHSTQMGGRYETHYDGVQVWETATGRPLARLDAGQVSCLAFAPDGSTVATSDMNGLRGWDAATGELVWSRPVGKLPRSMYTFSFTSWIEYSPDGKTIATALPDTTALLWAVPPRTPRSAALATAAEKDVAWAALLSPDAAKGVAAAWALADAGPAAVVLLRERLKPVAAIPSEQVQKWIAALGDPAFAKREAATKELAALGERAEPALRAALAGAPAEARQRIEKLLAAPLDAPPPETVRFLRAVHALEAIASQAAREQLQALAKGDPTAPETKAAAAAIRP